MIFYSLNLHFKLVPTVYNTWYNINVIMIEFMRKFHWCCMRSHSAGVCHKVAPRCVITGRIALDDVFHDVRVVPDLNTPQICMQIFIFYVYLLFIS